VLGHSDTRMTEQHYAHLAPTYIGDTIRAAFGGSIWQKPIDCRHECGFIPRSGLLGSTSATGAIERADHANSATC
jgi:hypothetical protein